MLPGSRPESLSSSAKLGFLEVRSTSGVNIHTAVNINSHCKLQILMAPIPWDYGLSCLPARRPCRWHCWARIDVPAEFNLIRLAETGSLKYNWSNISSFCFTPDFIRRAREDLDRSGRYHLARKEIPSAVGPVKVRNPHEALYNQPSLPAEMQQCRSG